MPKLIDERIKQSIVTQVLEEMVRYECGEITHLSSDVRLAELYGISPPSVRKILHFENRIDESICRKRRTVIAPSIDEVVKQSIANEVLAEMARYDMGEITRVSTSRDFSQKYGVSSSSVDQVLLDRSRVDASLYAKRLIIVRSLIDERTKRDIVAQVRAELIQFDAGEITRLSANADLEKQYGITRLTIQKLIKQRLDERTRLRRTEIIEQARRQSCSVRVTRLNKDPAYANAMSERMSALNADPDFKQASRERGKAAMTALHANPAFRAAHQERSRKKMFVLLADPEYRARHAERARKTIIALHKDPDFRRGIRERMVSLQSNPEFRRRTGERGREVLTTLNANPEFRAASSERLKRLHANPGFKQGLRERAMKRIEETQLYNVRGRFKTASLQEGAVALLLEKYVDDYAVNQGVTYQVRDRELQNGGIDFLVGDTFVEWHPVRLHAGAKGDISSMSYGKFKSLLERLDSPEKKRITALYSKWVATAYQQKRQAHVDNSGYAGHTVLHLQTVPELYDFLQAHSIGLPSLDEFKREFKQKTEEVRTYAVKKDETHTP